MPNLRPTVPDPRAAATAARAPEVRQLADMLGARVHIDITIPRTSVAAKMRLLSRTEEFEAKAAARAQMIEAGYPVNGEAHTALGAAEQWLVEVAVRMVAIAVRDPARPELALASLDDWRDCDDQQILALWSTYQDLERRLDPLGVDVLTDEQLSALEAAAKKKDADLLMAFGSRSLALFAITSVSRLAPSETPTSSPGS